MRYYVALYSQRCAVLAKTRIIVEMYAFNLVVIVFTKASKDVDNDTMQHKIQFNKIDLRRRTVDS